VKLTPPTIVEIKDATLKMEIEHAKAVGLSLRDAEAENVRQLERSEQIAKEAKPTAKNAGSRIRRAQRGVTTRVVDTKLAVPKPSPCGRCGTCRNCMRERRVLLIMQKRKEDPMLARLAAKLIEAAMRLGRFRFLTGKDYDRAVTACATDACDASMSKLGEWR
jgi:hypothetical protein